MTCTHCGSPAAPPTGYCGTCGQAVDPATGWSAPPGMDADATVILPAVSDATIPYGIPPITFDSPAPYAVPAQSHAGSYAAEPYADSGGTVAVKPYSPAPVGYYDPIQPHSPAPGHPGTLYSSQPGSTSAEPPHSPVLVQHSAPPPYGTGPSDTLPPYFVQPDLVYSPSRAAGNTLSILALALAVAALLIMPILGVGSIVCAGIAMTQRERLAVTALVLGIVGTAGGYLFGLLALF